MKHFMISPTIFAIFGIIIMSTIGCTAQDRAIPTGNTSNGTVHQFTVNTIDGAAKSLADYKGRVLLIVNVASQCGYTRQYANLEALHKAHESKGLSILGFPANNFGGQEPGTNAEIKEFCSTKFNVTFDMFEKISVKGGDKHPLYVFLTSGGGNGDLSGEVGWNF
ncbi:MAG: glutathione peroxidase, partial [Ignavibacteria bacterium]